MWRFYIYLFCILHYRAINYDEKDPFLCNACGFCKYAKFDFTLTAKPCCAVDPIENEDDRKKVRVVSQFLVEPLSAVQPFSHPFKLTSLVIGLH